MNYPREWFAGKKVAVAGTGVTGLAVARAVQALGGKPTALDEKPGDLPHVIKAVDQLQAAGIDVITGWHGHLDPAEFDLLIVSPGFPSNHPAMRDMAGKAIGEVEFAYQIARAPIVAITGTNGKSTTTVMLWLILRGSGRKAHLCGNIAGSGYPEQTFTEAALHAEPDDILVAEVSSAHLETIEEFRPKVALITNITQDHLDRYKTFDEYKNAKLNLYKNLTDQEVIVLNLDNHLPTLSQAQSKGKARLVTFSPSGGHSGNGQTRRDGTNLTLLPFNLDIANLPFSGEFNIVNAMAAWEMACCMAEPRQEMLDQLLSFHNLENRMEPVGERGGVRVINNSMCTNPAAVVACCQSLGDKVIHLIMGGNTKNMDFSPLRDYLKFQPHKVYLYDKDDSDLSRQLGRNYPVVPSLEMAFRMAADQAKAGEIILLAPGCSSAAPYANFRERGAAFREIAKDWLNG